MAKKHQKNIITKPKVKSSSQKPFEYTKYVKNSVLFIFFVFIVLLTFTKINGEDDIFWHLATGKYIVENKTVPSTDVFGFASQGVQWIPFEWGWDVLSYVIFSVGDFTGLYVLNALLTALIFYLLYNILDKYKIPFFYSLFFLIILALGIKYRLGIKPQMFSYLFLILTLKIIVDYKYFKANPNYLFFIPFIFLLWTNMHMGVLTGILLFFVFVVSEIYLLYKNKNAGNRNLYILLAAFGISVAAMLINPNSYNTYLYTYSHSQMKMLDEIYEWYSPFHQQYAGKLFIYIYYLFLAGFFVVLYDSYRKKYWFPAVVYLLFAVISVRGVRFTTDFMLASTVFFAFSFYDLYSGKNYFRKICSNKLSVYFLSGILILFIILIPGNNLFRFIGFNSVFGTGIYEPTFPVDAFRFIKDNKVYEEGNRPFHTFDYGGYFVWNFYGSKNFIDSRNLYDSLYYDFKKIYNKSPDYLVLIDKYDFDYFVVFRPALSPQDLENSVVSYLSRNNDKWKLIYFDNQSLLFVKNNVSFADLIAKYEFKFFTPYNLIYNKTFIEKAIRENKDLLIKEVERKKSEEPMSFFLQYFYKNFKL
ncbi:MAG: hypothetical protein FJ216_10595 [Ignavibacteria bacterium]|nr:hypothetical protein [Ignavibacteria bacterium]